MKFSWHRSDKRLYESGFVDVWSHKPKMISKSCDSDW